MDIFTSEDFLLAEKLRNEDPEQFFTLVRMHLSFVLDLNADECDANSEKKIKPSKWNMPFTKKPKFGSKNFFENTALTVEFIAQMKPVIEFLKKNENISQEGIFRRSGKVTRQHELKLLLHQGAFIDFNDNQFSVHECATVLKNILSELPESVLTDAHYPAYCQIAEFCANKNPSNNERLLRALQMLLLLLPNENRKFFQEIIELLHLAVAHEHKNRMSADNLATLFTPHLLCPRKLSPEALHTNSQVMSRVVAFMIQKGSELFEIPPTIATDIKVYWNKKERRKLSPLKQMNESICDGTAANTVFTFVDREKTAEENKTNPTETALAQLYAHIQSLPESSKKRKLVKQFNKENGYGTPLRNAVVKKRIKSLNLGDSIKKHLSGFSKATKRNVNQGATIDGEDDEVSNSDSSLHLKKNQNGDGEKGRKETAEPSAKSSWSKCSRICNGKSGASNVGSPVMGIDESSPKQSPKNSCIYKTSEEETNNISQDLEELESNKRLSPEREAKRKSKRSSTSPIEEMVLRKAGHFSEIPSKSLNEDGHHHHHHRHHHHHHFRLVSNHDQIDNRNFDSAFTNRSRNSILQSPKQAGIAEKESRQWKLIGDDSEDENSGKTSFHKFNNASRFVRSTNNEIFHSSCNNTNRYAFCANMSSFVMATSTPATGNGRPVTPIVDKNNSMSPITKSARRMPKAMQETMMTPRSRKPVISLSGTDLCSLVNSDSRNGSDSVKGHETAKSIWMNPGKKLLMEDSSEKANDSLSSSFRNYLLSRSVLTASPVDLSFTSRTDDFLSPSEKNYSISRDGEGGEEEGFENLTEFFDGTEMSESLLFCLDGNVPAMDPEVDISNGGRKLTDCSCSFSDSDENVSRVYETAL